jgi:hypothetical protein
VGAQWFGVQFGRLARWRALFFPLHERIPVTIRFAIALVLFSLISGFVGLNWTEFTTPTALSIGVGVIQAPVGLVMLGVLALVMGFFVIYALYLHTTELIRTRRLSKEMEAQRKLVNAAEESRVTELHNFITEHFAAQRKLDAEMMAAIHAKIESGTDSVCKSLEETSNSVSAQLGQLEDRLDKVLPARGDLLL